MADFNPFAESPAESTKLPSLSEILHMPETTLKDVRAKEHLLNKFVGQNMARIPMIHTEDEGSPPDPIAVAAEDTEDTNKQNLIVENVRTARMEMERLNELASRMRESSK